MMRTTLALLTLGLMVATGRPASAQDLPADDLIDGLEEAVKKKNDAQAVSIMELIQADFEKFEEGDQKKLHKAVDKCLGKRRDDEESALYIGVLNTLMKMGENGLKSAKKALKNKNVKDRADCMAACVRSIASHADDKSTADVIKMLVYKEPIVVAAAAEALGDFYSKKPEKDRKEIVDEIVKNYANYHSLAVANPREPVFRERLGVVERPMLRSLAQLTGVEHPDAPAWQKWYNDNKRKPWPERKQDEG